MKKKRSVFILAGITGFFLLLALSAALLWASGRGRGIPKAIQFNMTIRAGDTAPDFKLPTLTGEQMQLSQFRGQPVMINFGASWCPDCRKELPLLKKLQAEYPELVVFYVDTEEPVETVQAYVDKFELTFPLVLDEDGAVAKKYFLYAVPTVIFVDKEGVIQKIFVEAVSEQAALQSLAEVGIQP